MKEVYGYRFNQWSDIVWTEWDRTTARTFARQHNLILMAKTETAARVIVS